MNSKIRTRNVKSVLESIFLSALLPVESYGTILNFNRDKEIYKDATGLSPTFTLGANNLNGIGIILRLNKPTAVTFPNNFEASPNSASLSNTKLNVYTLVYFASWDGLGTPRVVYQNTLFTSV